jgi:hemerythrin-like domain-containing protein
MKATELLMQEHRLIERAITVLETAANRLDAGQAVRPGLFVEACDFNQNFADGCHHKKEEGVLFKSMQAHGVPVEGGPIGVMLYEHVQGRAFTRSICQASEKLERGDQSARSDLVNAARGYSALLRQHIYKEDNILFPMAARAIPVQEHDRVLGGFERVEAEEIGEGVHEKYMALVEALENELHPGSG